MTIAVNYVKEGNTIVSASKLFKVSVSAISKWISQLKKTGTVAPKKRPGAKPSIDIKEFRRPISIAFGIGETKVESRICNKKSWINFRTNFRIFSYRSNRSSLLYEKIRLYL